jgi:hypothetical protein
MIGLAGAHRTGKSTLARTFSERAGVPLVAASASPTFARLGRDPQVDYDFVETLFIQENILQDLCERWQAGGDYFVTDRTPLDLYAYALARVQRETLDEQKQRLLDTYKAKCASATEAYFRAFVIVHPGIPIVPDATKGPALAGYVDHIDALIMGLGAYESVPVYSIPKSDLDLNTRVEWMTKVVDDVGFRSRSLPPVRQKQLT